MESLMFKTIKTADQIAAEAAQQKLEQAEANRKAAYIAESDPLFFRSQRGEVTEQAWLDKVEEIKARYPKE
jgi:hypothetical protein